MLPAFAAEIDAHVATYDDMVPSVLFGELTRFVLDARKRGDDELVARCLAFFDAALRDGDEQIAELVRLSFVRDIGPMNADTAAFIESWPASLRREANRRDPAC